MPRGIRASISSDGFSKGAIVRMHLKDFMTYNEVEFTPGPNLNLILGPNGTGKSTIVSAICLGMSGKPSTIGRATQLGGYVRHGASKATIEIELHNPDGENFIVTREITTDNKSTWKLQRKPVTHAQVEEVIRKLHIQVDNLCQFLPQEQVQNFSRLKDKQLLMGTMKAVGKPELEEQFNELTKLQSNFGAVASHQEKDEIELKKLQEENKRWENDVKNFKERESLKEQVKTLEKKKVWLTFKEEVKLFKQAQEKAQELKDKYNRAAAQFKPLEKKISENEALASRTQAALHNKRNKYHQDLNALHQKLYGAETFKKKVDDLVNEFQAKKDSEKKRADTVRTFLQQINSYERQLEELKGKEVEASTVRRDVERQLAELNGPMTAIQERKGAAKDEERRANYELGECQSKIRKVEDVDRNRLETLRTQRVDVHAAVLWLRANKGRFKSPIYEPPVLSMNVVDANLAKYPETCISQNDLFAFLCEDKDDMNELIRVLREERRLNVNVVHSPPGHQPVTFEYQPNVPLSELRNWGFYTYIRELITAPEPVVRYLCKYHSIHNIPVGNHSTFDNFGTIRDQFGSYFSTFFGGEKMVIIRGSRYSTNKITTLGDVRPSRFLGQSIDGHELANLHQTKAEIERRLMAARQSYEDFEKQEIELSRQRETLRNTQNECMKVLTDGRGIKSRIDQKKQQLAHYEKEAIDLKSEERNTKLKCAECIKNLQTKLAEHQQAIEQLVVQDKEKEALEMYLNFLRNAISRLQTQLSEEKEQIRQLEQEKVAAESEAAAAKRRTKEAQEDAFRVLGVRNREDLSEELREKFRTLSNDVNQIEDEIHQANARIQLMGRADQQIVRDYEARQYRIEELLKKINHVNDRASSIKDDMDRLRSQFLPALQELISRINDSFGRYYASMKCAGEVCLYTGEGDAIDDYQNYGIKIRVKYRSSEPLQELSANHHSGGERAVATALYMLAMQELTQVPFRCVDEINQGMDPINERRVFDLLVQTACRETSAQYFLLTPKLLPGLNYSSNMKIHFVQNGEHVCNEWPVAKHLRAIKAHAREEC